MIPKTIHYCWFGGNPLPKQAIKCKESWKKFLPDFQIKEWNEQNFDIFHNDYTKFCYEHKMWAYLSDYVRLFVVEKEGGIYFDTDVELVKRPTDLLESSEAWYGWESKEFINTGLGFASVAHHKVVTEMMKSYEEETQESLRSHISANKTLRGCPRRNTWALQPLGLKQNGEMQSVEGAKILPVEYLCPFDDITGIIKMTDNTISIHWFSKSPHSKASALVSCWLRPLRRFIRFLHLSFIK